MGGVGFWGGGQVYDLRDGKIGIEATLTIFILERERQRDYRRECRACEEMRGYIPYG